MRTVLVTLLSVLLFAGCETKYDMIDSGKAKGRFDGNMYEYFFSNTYDWDSLRKMVEKADLVDLFEGKRAGFEQITFLGPTNHSIRRWMIENGIKGVADISKEACEAFVMRHIIKGKLMRDDFPRGEVVQGDGNMVGGNNYECAGGNKVWIYTQQELFQNLPDVGPIYIKIVSLETQRSIDVGSSNIEPDNGVVHSLNYNYTLGDL